MSFQQINTTFYSPQQQEKLAQAHIGIAGAGGLGSNCAMILARAGVETFTLIDFDTIQQSNLNRQFYFEHQIGQPKVEALATNLHAINPQCQLHTHITTINQENCHSLLDHCTIIIEAFDSAESKAMLAQTYLFDTTTPFICVSGIAGFGKSDRIVTQQVGHNSWLIGDTTSDVASAPPLAPAILIAAAKEADKALELILSE